MYVPSRGDVVHAFFPYMDEPEDGKYRPCVVMSVRECDFLALKITSSSVSTPWRYRIIAGSGQITGGDIAHDSWVDITVRAFIPFEDIAYKHGTLRPDVLRGICALISSASIAHWKSKRR